jgi:hypothetical protein
MDAKPDKIEAFWDWFVANLNLVEALLVGQQPEFAHEITRALKRLDAGLTWEAGPGHTRAKSFSISPTGDPAKLPLTESVVARAPDVVGWEFHPVKLPKPRVNHLMELRNNTGQKVLVNFSNYRYIMIKYDNVKFYDLEIVYDQSPRLDRSARAQLAYLIAESYLGERTMLTRIGNVSLVGEKDCKDRDSLTSISFLRQHFKAVAPDSGI